MEKSYIYKITCKENNKFYVGSTVDYERRWAIHKSLLNNNKHHSKVLQNCWNKYGEDIFQFEITETIDKQDKDFLLQREQYFLDTLKPELNICEIAGSCLGVKRTIEFGINKSLSQIGEKNHFFGKKYSDEIGKIFNSPRQTIASIINGKTYSEVK